jgi:hypothetical protein
MKKLLLCTIIFWAVSYGFAQNIDTIAAWTFPTGIDTLDIYPDVCIPDNVNRYIAAEDTASDPNSRVITCTEGESTFAGTATGWDDGGNSKLWSIKFKAPGYGNFKVSSKQFSDIEFPGPQDWKVEARLSGGDWVDLDGGTVVCSNDWTTGAVTEIGLPVQFNNPGSTSIYVRWIMTSNLSINGSDVLAEGISKIDDVVITGEVTSGIGNTIIDNQFRFFPNPVESGELNIDCGSGIVSINLYDMDGRIIRKYEIAGNGPMELNDLCSGVYFVEPVYTNNEKGLPKKLVVR